VSNLHLNLLSRRIFLIPPCKKNSPFPPPDQERHTCQGDDGSQHTAQDKHIVCPHVRLPRRNRKDHAGTDTVANEDDTYQGLSDYLPCNQPGSRVLAEESWIEESYVLIRILNICQSHITATAEGEADESSADGIDDPGIALEPVIRQTQGQSS
jgi:hypothetical protein